MVAAVNSELNAITNTNDLISINYGSVSEGQGFLEGRRKYLVDAKDRLLSRVSPAHDVSTA